MELALRRQHREHPYSPQATAENGGRFMHWAIHPQSSFSFLWWSSSGGDNDPRPGSALQDSSSF
jgi:hypothetical protein